MREWFQDLESADVDDASWDAAIERFDRCVDAVCARCPELAQVAAQVAWFADPGSDGWGSADQTDNAFAVVLSFKCLDHSDEVIEYVIAHELTHQLLGHVPFTAVEAYTPPDPHPEEGDEPAFTFWRIKQRAIEIIVADQLTRLGFTSPEQLHGYTQTGTWGVGFDTAGLRPQEIYDMLVGKISWQSLRDLAQDRGNKVHRGTLDDKSASVHAIAFWQEHMHAWQDSWIRDHEQLVARVAGG